MTLLITKKPNDVFSFVLAGDYSNEIKNIRNDLLTVGNFGHFKTSNGANLIKYQNIAPTDVTIVDGATTLNPTTTDELFDMLRSVGYFDWLLPSGGSGVSRFVDLSDTFGFFGQDGKTVVVDEAQMKLIPVTFYNVQNFVQLADVPNAHVAGKWLMSDGTKLIFADLPPAPTDPDSVPKGGYEGTGADLNNAIDNLQEQIGNLPGVNIQTLVDNDPKTAFIDGSNSTVSIMEGSVNNRTFGATVGDGEDISSSLGVNNNYSKLQNAQLNKEASIGSELGLVKISQANPSGTTNIGVDAPIADTTWKTPAKVAGDYVYASTSDVAEVDSASVHKTGEGFNYAIDFDDVLSQNSGLTIGKRTLKPESSRLPISNTTILGWGDSLTAGDGGTGSYLFNLGTITGFTMVNKGVGGESSTAIKDRFVADTGDYDKTVIIWAGRNNFINPTTVKADIATMVAALTHTRFLVLGILNQDVSTEWTGTTNLGIINQLNADLKAIYGKKFLDIRPYLVSLNDNSPQSIIDRANDVYPYFLRVDTIHPNPAGALIMAEYVDTYLGILYEKEGYLQSKDFKYYANLYDTYLHTSGNENVTGVKTFTNTLNPFTNGLNFINSGPANSKSENFSVSGGGYGSDYTVTGFSVGSRYTVTSGNGIRLDVAASQTGVLAVGTGSGGSNFRNTVNGTGFGVRSDNNSTGYAFYGVNAVGGIYDFAQNNGTGVLKILESSTVSTGDLLRFTKNGTTTTKFDQNGILTTPSPIISSETANTIASFDATKNVKSLSTSTYPSLTELAYVKGVTSAIQGQIDSKAPLASPALTGVPTAPTASAGTNTTQLATTAFVKTAIDTDVSIQKIVDNATRYGELDGGNSYIYTLLGSANNRIFKAKTGDATNSGEIYSSNNEVLLRGEISGVSTGVFQVFNGLTKITQASASGTTTIGVIPATVNTTINNPANSVAGTYIYQMQPKEYTVSTLPTPTGSDSRFAIVTDATAPTYLGTLTGGGSVVCPAFWNGSAWVSH